MDNVKEARAALAIGLSFERQEKGALIYWDDKKLFFPCEDGEPTLTAVAVGAIYALVIHNCAAILDGKDSFEMIVGSEKIELPVKYYKLPDNVWNYDKGIGWRSNKAST